jgi:hypothetical protein
VEDITLSKDAQLLSAKGGTDGIRWGGVRFGGVVWWEGGGPLLRRRAGTVRGWTHHGQARARAQPARD